ncbi:MAG: CDP-glucose 4,6-dehydratase [Bacteroidetes bacterium]|nr:MAG: CDP-glucose 4,6-dehydratase [Bacteroidota bacterium]
MENMVNSSQLFSFYKGKKIFVTGHTGFKGSWLCACLYTAGAQVKGYALAPDYQNGLYDLFSPFNISESIIADIRDKEKLEKEIISFQPDFIFHLAAQPLVRRSYEIPAETFEVNVVGTANVLEAVKLLNNKCSVIVITTDKVYENKEKGNLFTEDDRLGGHDPYSASKAATEIVVQSFRDSFFDPSKYSQHQKGVASARAGNVIGGGDWSKDRIVPDIIRSLQQHKSIEVRNPRAIRPWQHVLEPLNGYLLLGYLLNEKPAAFAKAFNFGPQHYDHLSVKELVEIAIKAWGSGEWSDISDPSQPHEAELLKLDINRAENELGWKPIFSAKEAIEKTIEWYKQATDKQATFTFEQIRQYFQV